MTLLGGGSITNDVLKFRKVIKFESLCIVICFSNHRYKKSIYQLRKELKIYEINQRLKLWAHVPIAVSSSTAAAHMYRWTPWTIHPSLASSSRKNTKVETKKNRNIQLSLFFTVWLNVTFTDNWQDLRI